MTTQVPTLREKPAAAPSAAVHRPRPVLLRELGVAAGGTALSVVLLTLIFQPLNLWPLAFVALAPWTYVICGVHRAWIDHWASFVGGFAFFLVNLSWLYPVTDLGYVALAAYLAMYWPLACWAVRTGRRLGISAAWTLPVVWVACEYLRAWVMSGFPWLFLSHSFHAQLHLIQISDLTGAYGVTFIAAMVGGVLAEWVLIWRRKSATAALARQLYIATPVAAALIGGTLAYGTFRVGQAKDFEPGPLISVVQHDFVQLAEPPYAEPREVIFSEYLALGAKAAADAPDLLVFPETAWGSYQNIGFLQTPLNAADDTEARAYAYGMRTHEAVSGFARGDYRDANEIIASFETTLRQISRSRPEWNLRTSLPRLPAEGGPATTVIIGSISIDKNTEAITPSQKKFNSALVYDPDGRQRLTRYDKKHLVPFGEFVPFRNARLLGLSLHPLYVWLNRLSPFSYGGKIEYSLWPGSELTAFELDVDGRTYRFGTPICYEDVMPYLIREYVWGGGERRVDFLVNISNDGWFLHSAELAQHLAIGVFRAVENRVCIARAVNTGISGFVDPNGRIYGVVEKDGRTLGPGVIGWATQRVLLDQRTSFYGRYGDWFAAVCLAASVALWLSAMVTRWVMGIRSWIQRRFAKGGA